MIIRYLEYLDLPSSIQALALAVGVGIALLDWLAGSKPLRAGLRGAIWALVALAFQWCCELLRGRPDPTWWPIICGFIGMAVGVLVAVRLKARSAAGPAVTGVVLGVALRYALEYFLGPYALKYVMGIGLASLVPLAAVTLLAVALTQLIRSRTVAPWVSLAFTFCGFALVYRFAAPALPPAPALVLGAVVNGLLPCVIAALVVGSHQLRMFRMGAIGVLYVVVGVMLSEAAGPGATTATGIGWLLQPVSAWVLCVLLLALTGAYAIRIGAGKVDKAGDWPLWVVATPWLSMPPALYFGRRGLIPLGLFLASNAVVGALFLGWRYWWPGGLSLVENRGRRPRSFGTWQHLFWRWSPGIGTWSVAQKQVAWQAGISQVIATGLLAAVTAPSPPPEIVEFTASARSVSPGAPVKLSWVTKNATSATLQPGPSGLPTIDEVEVTPRVSTSYVLEVKGSGGATTRSITMVEVVAPRQTAPGAPSSTPAVAPAPAPAPAPVPEIPLPPISVKRAEPSPEERAESKRHEDALAEQQAELERQQAEAQAAMKRRLEQIGK